MSLPKYEILIGDEW